MQRHNEVGVIGIISKAVFGHMNGWPWPVALVALVAAYLYVHYAFASMTAHVTALYPGFLAAALTGGVPPMLAALALAYFSNIKRRHHALRHGLSSGLLRGRLCRAGNLVEARLPDLDHEPTSLAGRWIALVEASGVMVT